MLRHALNGETGVRIIVAIYILSVHYRNIELTVDCFVGVFPYTFINSLLKIRIIYKATNRSNLTSNDSFILSFYFLPLFIFRNLSDHLALFSL